jgi:hypothetical protein
MYGKLLGGLIIGGDILHKVQPVRNRYQENL